MGVDYYERASAANGRDSMDFMRLFMIPGMAHCGGGLGPDQYDAVTAVVDWVEKGVAPDSLVASKIVGGAGDALAPALPVPAGRPLPRAGQHGRGREFRMQDAVAAF